MKILLSALFLLIIHINIFAQCSTVSVQIASSDTSFLKLYNAGFFNIPSGSANICEWEVTTFSGEVIFQETTSGDFEDQSSVQFDHMVPITDSIKASIIITNEVEGITCTITDTLFWEETEIIPNVFSGNWAVLSSNGGVEEEITSNNFINRQLIEIYPSPAQDFFMINGNLDTYSFQIININGQILESYFDISSSDKIDISNFSKGMYFVQLLNNNQRKENVYKLIKS